MPRYTYSLYQQYTCYESATIYVDATSEDDALAQLGEIIDNGNIDWEFDDSDHYGGITHELEGIEHLTPSMRLSEL